MRDKLLREFSLRAWNRSTSSKAGASSRLISDWFHAIVRAPAARCCSGPASGAIATCAPCWFTERDLPCERLKDDVPHAASGLAVSSSDAKATWRRWHWRIRMRECCGRYSQGVRVIDQRRFPTATATATATPTAIPIILEGCQVKDNTTSGDTIITVTPTTGVIAFDMAVIAIAYESSTITVTPPEGFTLISHTVQGSFTQNLYWHEIASSADDSWMFMFLGTVRAEGGVLAYSGTCLTDSSCPSGNPLKASSALGGTARR